MSLVVSIPSFAYPGATTPALHDIDISLQPGKILGIAGPCGSGKSTLCQRIVQMTDKARIGYVQQNPELQLFAKTAWDDVAFGPRNQGLNDDQVSQRVTAALSTMGIDVEAAKDTSPFAYSGGERRRIAIAGVLAPQPNYLILDEPDCGLDCSQRKNLINLLKQLATEGMGIMLVTHDAEMLLSCTDQVAIMDQGTIATISDSHSTLSNQALCDTAGISMPVRLQLENRLAKAGIKLDALLSKYGKEDPR